jgi:protein gp37
MNKTSIEWCTRTWNPVTGCLHGCRYCFARRIAHRFGGYDIGKAAKILHHGVDRDLIYEIDSPCFHVDDVTWKMRKASYPFGFAPTFHRYRLGEPAAVKRPQNIFVVDMGDLFGNWVPEEWIREVSAACMSAPQHQYLFLTKNPKRWNGLLFDNPENMWFGQSIPTLDVPSYVWAVPRHFLSIEPLMEAPKAGANALFGTSWVIVGAMTGPKAVAHQPRRKWVQAIVDQCRAAGVPVFLKNNLQAIWGQELIQEYPEGLREVAERAKK